jgi:hypothetical protein
VNGGRSDEEVFLPLHVPRSQLALTTQFRSTWVVSSQNTLRDRGHYRRYLELLPEQHRDALSMMIVGGWVPMDVATAHYGACEALDLPASERLAIGRAVTKHLNQTLLSTAVRLASQSGATLWTPLSHFYRLWNRMFVGGGVTVVKLGPKEARIEMLGCTLAHIPYFRSGLQGVLLGIGELFSQRVYAREVPRVGNATPATTVIFRGSWV